MSGLEVRCKKIDEITKYFIEEIKHNNLMSKQYKKTCSYLNYIKHWLLSHSTITYCISIS